MLILQEKDMKVDNRKSSKGNQLKWMHEHTWYKTDYTGYEGLSEYLVSKLLEKTSLHSDEYIAYDTEMIQYHQVTYPGCKSEDFLPDGWQLITLERLFLSYFGESLYKSIFKIADHKERLQFLVNQVIRITGLGDFGKYMCKLLSIDAFFLNEDRHMHNIAVLTDGDGNYSYCPFFDHGAALLSDIMMDYPMNVEWQNLLENVQAKTFCSDFDEQLDIAESLYGKAFTIQFTEKDVMELLEKEPYYTKEIKARVLAIVRNQIRKYQNLK